MFLYHSTVFRVAIAAFAVAGCNEAKFHSGDIPRKTVSASANAEKEEDLPTQEVNQPIPEPESEPVPEPTPPSTELPLPPKPPLTRYETTVVEETFFQEGLPGVADIALVIDDSGSMDKEQENLSTKLGDLLVALKQSDWQIGVITTTVKVEGGKDVCQLKLIRSTDSDVEEKFREAVTPGVGGSGEEQGVRQAVNALRCHETPWVRPDSTVAVLIVSDEDNCSKDGEDCGNNPWAKESYLIDFVEKDLRRTVGKNAGFYGIIVPTKEKCETAKNLSAQYERLINYKAGGNLNYGNICDASYKNTLERISKNIAKLLSAKFMLKQVPDADSTKIVGVKANGEAITPNDYTVNGTTITFKIGSEPALGSQIVTNYKVTTTISE